jgi:hypothetical protein
MSPRRRAALASVLSASHASWPMFIEPIQPALDVAELRVHLSAQAFYLCRRRTLYLAQRHLNSLESLFSLAFHGIEAPIHPFELPIQPLEASIHPLELPIQPVEAPIHPLELCPEFLVCHIAPSAHADDDDSIVWLRWDDMFEGNPGARCFRRNHARTAERIARTAICGAMVLVVSAACFAPAHQRAIIGFSASSRVSAG